MEMQGSCRCGSVKFQFRSQTPYPYMRCYCSICRKLDGGGGFTINIMGLHETLAVTGDNYSCLKTYAVMLPDKEGEEEGKMHPTSNVRSFCGSCGTHLWAYDEQNWPKWFYPFAGAIDTDLPVPPHSVHIMLGSKASWVTPQVSRMLSNTSSPVFLHFYRL